MLEISIGGIAFDPPQDFQIRAKPRILGPAGETAARGFHFPAAMIPGGPQQHGAAVGDLGRHHLAGYQHRRRLVIRHPVLLSAQERPPWAVPNWPDQSVARR